MFVPAAVEHEHQRAQRDEEAGHHLAELVHIAPRERVIAQGSRKGSACPNRNRPSTKDDGGRRLPSSGIPELPTTAA